MRLLVVGAGAADIELLEGLLSRAGFSSIISTCDPASVHHLCVAERPDLLLLDLDMPRRSALSLIEKIRDLIDDPERLPVLVLAAEGAIDARGRAISMGAHDFVTKPVEESELLQRVRNALQTRHLYQLLADRDALSEALREQSLELEYTRLESLTLLASVAEYHDDETQQHTRRVGESAGLIALALELPDAFVSTIRDAAPLHDIGKVGISRRILIKPGELTPAERMHMMRHVEIGARILASARSPVLRLAAQIALTHHERWDGSGYMAGLAGKDIPLAGRITAVADAFDILTHERPYKPRWEIDRALAEIAGRAGHQFDPHVVDAFATIDPAAITERLAAAEVQHAA